MNYKKIKQNNKGKRKYLRTALYIFIAIAAAAVIISTTLLPLVKVSSDSMSPTIKNNDYVFMLKTKKIEKGGIIGFYYENKLLIKRVIGLQGDLIDIDESGNVYVNNKIIDEPYIKEKSAGQSDIDFPVQVPAGTVFVLNDDRSHSTDSRSKALEFIKTDQIEGKVIFKK